MAERMKLGAKVPSSGPVPRSHGIGSMASDLEDAGFQSLWCSDHVVMPQHVESLYPFSDDGSVTWDLKMPWYDAVVALSCMQEATTTAEIGVAVLVLALRHPLTFAKQAASIDALSEGRLAIGVGAGWLSEEFEALGVDFDSRGPRMDSYLELMRHAWSGSVGPSDDEYHHLPAAVWTHPTPARPVPILIGGMSAAALRRTARLGDGWLALQRADELDAQAMASAIGALREHCASEERDPSSVRVVLRVIESAGRSEVVAAQLKDLWAAGVTEVVVDTSWDGDGDADVTAERLRNALD